jgi:uncharacterized protein involved in exopolysaccharide biosynthesis
LFPDNTDAVPGSGDIAMDTDAELPRSAGPGSPSGVSRPMGSPPARARSLVELLGPLAARRKLLCFCFVAAGLVAFAVASLLTPVYTARTVFFVPQPRPLESPGNDDAPGPLAGLGKLMTLHAENIDFELLQSTVLLDRLVDSFDLMRVYDVRLREKARKELQDRVRVGYGKKDLLFTVEVEDTDPVRAAELANRHVDEFQHLKTRLATTQAHARRALFEAEVGQARSRLDQAQRNLQAGGFDEGALHSEPIQMIGAQAALQAQLAANQVGLQVLRQELGEDAPGLKRQEATLASLREELGRLEASSRDGADSIYAAQYRQFKYQETLFNLLSPQLELARLEESRPFAVQVVDRALPPDRRSRPRRSVLSAAAALLALLVASAGVLLHARGRQLAEGVSRKGVQGGDPAL